MVIVHKPEPPMSPPPDVVTYPSDPEPEPEPKHQPKSKNEE